MDTEYDFVQTVNTQQLVDEINTAGLPAADYINTSGNCVSIFYVNPLTTDQQSTLTTVVANHVANPNYIPLATQAQINTLVAYLNNSNPTIVNTTRAVIVSNIAPNLPIGTITAINAQIKAIVGS